MSSATKFPSGLNNWAPSDKPTRADFVSDNEILDENTLWKADYDADGAVAQAGGITAYAMGKESYDADGTVAQLGGIMAAVATNDGFATYVHSKAGATHTLVNANGGDNVKFVATANFEREDGLMINGATVTVLDSGGEPTGKAFREGDTVLMQRRGSEVRVTSPLANGTIFNVITADPPPATAPEGTICLPGVFSAVSYAALEPASPVDKELWLPEEGHIQIRGRAIKDILYRVGTPQAYNAETGEWLMQSQAKVMLGGIWVPLESRVVWYDRGTENISFSVAPLNASVGGGTVTKYASYIRAVTTASPVSYAGCIGSDEAVDLTGIKTIEAVVSGTGGSGGAENYKPRIWVAATRVSSPAAAEVYVDWGTEVTGRLDVCALSGRFYIGVSKSGASPTDRIDLFALRGE